MIHILQYFFNDHFFIVKILLGSFIIYFFLGIIRRGGWKWFDLFNLSDLLDLFYLFFLPWLIQGHFGFPYFSGFPQLFHIFLPTLSERLSYISELLGNSLLKFHLFQVIYFFENFLKMSFNKQITFSTAYTSLLNMIGNFFESKKLLLADITKRANQSHKWMPINFISVISFYNLAKNG